MEISCYIMGVVVVVDVICLFNNGFVAANVLISSLFAKGAL